MISLIEYNVVTGATKTLTFEEVQEAADWADERAAACHGLDELEQATDFRRVMRRCPRHFTREQRLLAHSQLAGAYMRLIGRG